LTNPMTSPPPAAAQPVVARRAPAQPPPPSTPSATPSAGANTTPAAASTLARVAAPSPPKPATKPLAAVNIDQARNRIRSGKLIEPADDSALFFLRRAQEAGEDTSALRIAATDLGQRLLDGVRSAWSANQSTQAQRLLEAAGELDRQFDLGLPDLDKIAGESKRLMAAASADQARTQRLAAAMQAREAGQLIEPPGGSAYERLSALVSDYPNAEDVRAERQRLASALVAGGDAALKAGNRRRAQLFSERAGSLMPDMPEVSGFVQTVAAASKQPIVVPGATLPRVRTVPPKYPRAAERDGIEGTVDVEFTIAPDGTTRDLIVRDSNPKVIFDDAAVEAVSKWVFKPVLRDGEAVAQRTILKIQFSMKQR